MKQDSERQRIENEREKVKRKVTHVKRECWVGGVTHIHRKGGTETHIYERE